MTKDEILNKAVFVVLPVFTGELERKNKADTEFLDLVKTKFPDNRVYALKPAENDLYAGWHLNEHHYTTEYHLRHMLPVYANAFGIRLVQDEWRYRKNIVSDGGKEYDLSTIEPKGNHRYKITCRTFGFSVGAADLRWHDGYPLAFDCKTEYHKMYAFSHCVSWVEHISGDKNGKSILVLCDSQMVPSIPLLCAFYKEVFVFDNRFGLKTSGIYENRDFDDVLVCLWRDGRFLSAGQRFDNIVSSSFVE